MDRLIEVFPIGTACYDSFTGISGNVLGYWSSRYFFKVLVTYKNTLEEIREIWLDLTRLSSKEGLKVFQLKPKFYLGARVRLVHHDVSLVGMVIEYIYNINGFYEYKVEILGGDGLPKSYWFYEEFIDSVKSVDDVGEEE